MSEVLIVPIVKDESVRDWADDYSRLAGRLVYFGGEGLGDLVTGDGYLVPGNHRLVADRVLLEHWEESGRVVDEELIILAREFGSEPSSVEFLKGLVGERVELIPVNVIPAVE